MTHPASASDAGLPLTPPRPLLGFAAASLEGDLVLPP
jgi:hypothetical protein